MELYEETGTLPGTFVLDSEYGGQAKFTLMDKYIELPKDDNGRRVEELKERWGDSIIATSRTFQLNQSLVEKYFDAITSHLTDGGGKKKMRKNGWKAIARLEKQIAEIWASVAKMPVTDPPTQEYVDKFRPHGKIMEGR